MDLALVLVAVVTGSLLQRSTGLGFALVSAPFLVLLMPPFEGIALANLLSLLTGCLVLAATYRDVDLRLAGWLLAGAVVAIAPGAALARSLPPSALLVLVGGLTTVATMAVVVGRPIVVLRRRYGPLLAGCVSGFSNVTAGVGGPALAVYGASTGLRRERFVPTVQVVGIVTNGLSLLAKHDADLEVGVVLGCVAAVLVGTLVGRGVSRIMGERTGRAIVLGLALVGGLFSVLKGLLG